MVVLSQNLDQSVDGMLEVFEFTEQDNNDTEKLNFRMQNRSPSLADKQRRSIYYMLEMTYGLLLSPNNNISSNPGWEQALRQYGR